MKTQKHIKLIILTFLSFNYQCQIIYYQNFDSLNFFSSINKTNEWQIDNMTLQSSNGYNTASGNYYLAASNGSETEEVVKIKANLNCKKCSNIVISWGVYKDRSFPGPLTFELSQDGSDWKKIDYMDTREFGKWTKIKNVKLPKSFENLESIYLKWSYKSNNNLNYCAIDDITITSQKTK